MANQYEVLGKAPVAEDLQKLSAENVHLTIKGLSAGYGKMEILHNFDLFVSKYAAITPTTVAIIIASDAHINEFKIAFLVPNRAKRSSELSQRICL